MVINLSFLPDSVIKYEDSFVLPDYRGKGIYKMLFKKRDDYVNHHFKGYTIISYCKPTTLAYFKKQGFIEKEIITLVEKNLAPWVFFRIFRYMIIVKIGKNENINRALKRFKVKVRNSKTMEEYRSRKEFVKKSVKRRREIDKAKYIQSIRTKEEQ